MSAITDERSKSSKVMSALSTITSLASSLLPNTLDFQQINYLISSLIQLPSIGNNGDVNSQVINGSMASNVMQMRREKHRQTERVRHNTIIEMIRQLSQMIGSEDRQDTQANILNRAARYVLFLSHVIEKLESDSNDNNIDILSEEWLQSLYPLYERAFEEATNLIENCYESQSNCISESTKDTSEPIGRSLDHCISLV